jgi:hypothetical protein
MDDGQPKMMMIRTLPAVNPKVGQASFVKRGDSSVCHDESGPTLGPAHPVQGIPLKKKEDQKFRDFCNWWYQTDDECQIEYFLTAVAKGKLDQEALVTKGNVAHVGYFTDDELFPDEEVRIEELDDNFRKGKLKSEFIRYYSGHVAKREANLRENVQNLLGQLHDDLVSFLDEEEYLQEAASQFNSARDLYNLIGPENVLYPDSA